MTADATEAFLQEKQMSLFVKNGGMPSTVSRFIEELKVGFDSGSTKTIVERERRRMEK